MLNRSSYPTRAEDVNNISISQEVQEVNGKQIVVISITTGNPTDTDWAYQYRFAFYQTQMDAPIRKRNVTIRKDGSELQPAETSEWKFKLNDRAEDVNFYTVDVQPPSR